MSFTKVAIAGVSSEVGKTTLLCDLLRELPGWEAIKMTRGHYRSCGKDPHTCCVSHLLGDEPIVRSGFQQTYASDKDTGRYWDAGAANVHWVIVTENQVERGIELALERVKAPGVLIEGNSFLRFIDVDFALLVTGDANTKIKASARWAFQKASAVYDPNPSTHPGEAVQVLNRKFALVGLKRRLPAYAASDFPNFVEYIKQVHSITSYVTLGLESGLVRLPRPGAQVPSLNDERPASYVTLGLESGLVRLPHPGAQVPSLNDGRPAWEPRSVHDHLSKVGRVRGEQS